MTRNDRLGIWVGEFHLADVEARDEVGHVLCRYRQEALGRWEFNSPVLSCSLPLDEGPLEATAFFRGLLPEGEALRIMAERVNVTTSDTLALLDHYGRDVAGALVIGRGGPTPRRFALDPLTADDLERAVDDLGENPLGIVDESELSLAGLQNKMLLVKDGGQWARPLNGLPSTHILKVDDPRFPGLVKAERSCLVLARRMGLTTVDAEMLKLGEHESLVVSRFDREVEQGRVVRIHQEDLCQATGLDPTLNRGRVKYERYGGPGYKAMAEILDRYATDPAAQLARLVEIIVFTVAIGNADAHGKNLSLLHRTAETIELAPLYDTVPTRLWPKLRAEAAMAVGGQVELEDITLGAIGREAARWPFPEARARDLAERSCCRLLEIVESQAGDLDPGVVRYVATRTKKLLESR